MTAPYYERVNHLPIFLSDALHNLMHESFDDIFPAAALVIIQRERVVFSGAWGWIDPQTRQIPATPDAYFDLASVSKLFAATAFLTLVNEGRVRLDDALVSIVPEFGSSGLRGTDGGQDPFSKAMLPTAPHMEGRQVDPARVTFRHLLTHTSGLAPWRALYRITGVTPPPPNEPDPTPRAERWQKALRMICDSPFVDEPGKSIRYSDLGFLLLGESIARLHGTSLEEALAARVLRPLGLTSIGYLPMQRGIARESIIPTELDEDWRGRRCWGEVDDENACGIGGVAGHAGLFGTAHDVALLGATWLIPHSLLSISPELRAEAVREQAFDERDRRGLGWQLPYRGAAPPAGAQTPIAGCVNAYGQTGFTGTSLWIALEQQLVVACLTNRVYMGRFKEGIAAFRPKLHDLIAAAFH